jgi:hypothetical protein
MFKGNPNNTKRGKEVHGKPFTLHHCWAKLEDCEKWKNCDVLEVPKRSLKSSMIDDIILDGDEASSDDGKRSPTSDSIAKTKDLLEALVNVHKEMAEERKIARILEK